MIIVKFAPIILLLSAFSLLACAAQIAEVKVNDKTNIDYVEFVKVEGASLNGMAYSFDKALVKIHGIAKNGEGKKDANGGVADVGFTKSAVIVGMKLKGDGTAPAVSAGTRIEFSEKLELDSFSVIGADREYIPRPVKGTKYNFKHGVILVDSKIVGNDYKASFSRFQTSIGGEKKGEIRSLVIEFNGLVPAYIFADTPDGRGEYSEWILTDRLEVALGEDFVLIDKPDPYGLARHIVRDISAGSIPYVHTSKIDRGYDLEGQDVFGAMTASGVQLIFNSLPDYTHYDSTSRSSAGGSTQNPLKELPSSKQRAIQAGDTRTIRSGVAVRKVSFGAGSVSVTLSGVGAKDDVLVMLAKTVDRSPEFDLIEAVADYYGDKQYADCVDKLMGGKSLLDFAADDALTKKGMDGAKTSALSSNAHKECAIQYWNILSDCVGKKTKLGKGALAFQLPPNGKGDYQTQYKNLEPVAEYFQGPNIYELYVYVNKKRVIDGVYVVLQDLNPVAMARVSDSGEGSAHTYLAYAGQPMPTTDGEMILDCAPAPNGNAASQAGCVLSVGENDFAEFTSTMRMGTLVKAKLGKGYAMITAFGTSSSGSFDVYAPVGTLGTKKLSCRNGIIALANGNCFLVTVAQ
ncbi:Uncharacterised protein [Candidatus Norongarragalina meridionalis]|nr:Uncharacterised protein [Candidatus Norongarragalina meridionalis]